MTDYYPGPCSLSPPTQGQQPCGAVRFRECDVVVCRPLQSPVRILLRLLFLVFGGFEGFIPGYLTTMPTGHASGEAVVGVTIAFTILALLATSGRMFTRLAISRSPGLDDGFIVLSVV